MIEAAQYREFWIAVIPALALSFTGSFIAWRAHQSGHTSGAHVACLATALACLTLGVGWTWIGVKEVMNFMPVSDYTTGMVVTGLQLAWATTYATLPLAALPSLLSASIWLHRRVNEPGGSFTE